MTNRGLYVHIPFCVKKCPYCAFYSEPIDNYDVSKVVSALIKELSRYRDVEFSTVYIGGGSPSCLPEEQLGRLVETINEVASDPCEFTIEVNPSSSSSSSPSSFRKILERLYNSGVSRVSIGAQSFNDDELRLLGRGHNSDDIMKTVEAAKGVGFDNISIDLMFAIPGSTMDSWKRSLEAAIGLGVQHISAYSLTYEKDTPFSNAKKDGRLVPVDEEADRAMYETAIDVLSNAGYKQYEVSNFARPGFECEHNKIYWKNDEYIGIGPAAGSYYAGKRTMNIADIAGYVRAIQAGDSVIVESEEPGKEDIACEIMVLGLRMTEGVDFGEFKDRAGFDAEKVFAEPISRHIRAGLMEIVSGRLRLTRAGLPVADRILCDFAAI